MTCDICGRRIKKRYLVIFNRRCCSDACVATVFDAEYNLPRGATLNEILYRRAQRYDADCPRNSEKQ